MTNTSTSPLMCLYHDKKWRCEFQHLVNQVRCIMLPVRYIAKFHRLVCVCKPCPELDKYPVNFRKTVEEFNAENVKSETFQNFFSKLIKSGNWNEEEPRKSCKSSLRLVYLLSCVVREDFEIFEEKQENRIIPNEPYFTSSEIQMNIDGFAISYVGLMVGKKGRNIIPVQKKLGCKRINITQKCTEGTSGRIVAQITYPVCRPTVLMETKAALEKIARRIVTERKYHLERRRLFEKRLLERGIPFRATTKGNICNTKEANTRMYERHFQANKKYTTKQEHVSKLEGSHCLNCMIDYTTKLFQEAQCTHHPGYKVMACEVYSKKKKNMRYRWTCCDGESKDSFTTPEEHQQTGCKVHIHNWRPQRRHPKRDSIKHENLK